MLAGLCRLFDDGSDRLPLRTALLFAIVVAANILAWLWAFIALRDHPVLLGTAFLAYTFGLRHAVDADHIAAIDNVARKLVQMGKKPISVGFFFSLGHSTVVIVASVLVALAVSTLNQKIEGFRTIGSVIGTAVSSGFLLLIALANIVILISVVKMFRAVRRGERFVDDELNVLLSQRGVIGRMLRSLFGVISKSWHMYPLGLLFGLGFDTATEIAVLGIAASQSLDGLSMWTIMVFPALFTAGMSLIDTADGVFMVRAYDWALIKPIRKLYYNMTITAVSVIVALLIGGVQALGLIASKLDLNGPFWSLIEELNENFGMLGYAVVGVFLVSWLISMAVYRMRGYDEIEVRT